MVSTAATYPSNLSPRSLEGDNDVLSTDTIVVGVGTRSKNEFLRALVEIMRQSPPPARVCEC